MKKKLTDKQAAKRQSALVKIDNVFKKVNEAGLNKKGNNGSEILHMSNMQKS